MVTSVAPGPGIGFPTHSAESTAGNLLSNGFISLDLPPSETGNPAQGSQSNGTNNLGSATYLSGARMHLKLPRRHQEDSIPDQGSSPLSGMPEMGHHRRTSSFARARAQTVSDQTGLRTYQSISSVPVDSTEDDGPQSSNASTTRSSACGISSERHPHFLTAHPTPQISPIASKRQIITLDTEYDGSQSLGSSLSGLGWEETMDARPESPLPLPSPMPLPDDKPGSKSIFGRGPPSLTGEVELNGGGEPLPSVRSTEAENGMAGVGRKGSKTKAFFSVSFGEGLPAPPRPLRESEVSEKTTNPMSSCPALNGHAGNSYDSQTAPSAKSPRQSRNSIFDTDASETVIPTRNRQRSVLGLGTSPARRSENPFLNVDSGPPPADGEPVFSEFSSSSARRASLAAAGVNRARSLGEAWRPSKSNAIFSTSHALPPPPRSPTSTLSHMQRPLQELPSPAETTSVYTVSPSPSPLTATFGDRLSMNDRSSNLRNVALGIPDPRAVTMPFSLTQENVPSSASSPLPISPVESSSSMMEGQTKSGALPSPSPSNSFLSPHKRLTREVSNSNCNDRTTKDALPDNINVKPGDVLEPEFTTGDGHAEIAQAWKLEKVLGEGAFSRVWSARRVVRPKGKAKETDMDVDIDREDSGSEVVAIKMMDKRICKDNDRTRISFEREVAVLKRISHPQVVEYKSAFSTKYFNCLVLEQVTGGELFDLLQQRGNHRRMGEDFLRRVFTELCRGVYWLHCARVVHRDLKLENIMFTVNPFDLVDKSDPNAKIPIDALPPQLVKLTDFGLARFIDPAAPRLETRCGSESFAAPEIIMGMPYDGRDTDAWAVGVILFALITCELPFDRSHSEGNGSLAFGHRTGHLSPEDDDTSRRRQLMRIARGAYDWPAGKGSEGVKRVVAKLLVRDPARRSRVDRGLWDEIWMNGPGSLPAPDAYDDSAPWTMEGGRRKVLDGYVTDSESMELVAGER